MSVATLPDARRRLDAVHNELERFWGRLNGPVTEDWRMRFELAVSEIAANIVEHARAEEMQFDIGLEGRRVVAEFTDSGRACPSRCIRPRPRDPFAERGRGLALARSLLDELSYERVGATNSWRLVKAF
jgi:serine/threonine-protein kinase RsbW